LYAYYLALVFGFCVGISETVQWAVIPKYVAAELCGTTYGIYNLITGIGIFISNITFGYLSDSYSITSALAYSLFFSLCAIGGIIFSIKQYSSYPRLY
jgi:MFS family permease